MEKLSKEFLELIASGKEHPVVGWEYQSIAAELLELRERTKKERKEHPRAFKLMDKGEYFLVVAKHEPYFEETYRAIRREERKNGTWSKTDEYDFEHHVYGVDYTQSYDSGG